MLLRREFEPTREIKSWSSLPARESRRVKLNKWTGSESWKCYYMRVVWVQQVYVRNVLLTRLGPWFVNIIVTNYGTCRIKLTKNPHHTFGTLSFLLCLSLLIQYNDNVRLVHLIAWPLQSWDYVSQLLRSPGNISCTELAEIFFS